MKYENIRNFSQRCEEHPDHQSGMISHQMLLDRAHEEIDELREFIEQAQNPLHDDAAAFRFLMKYNLGLVHGWESVPDATALATVWISFQGNNCIAEEVKGDDPMAAARRAIVSAVHYIENDLQEDLRDYENKHEYRNDEAGA